WTPCSRQLTTLATRLDTVACTRTAATSHGRTFTNDWRYVFRVKALTRDDLVRRGTAWPSNPCTGDWRRHVSASDRGEFQGQSCSAIWSGSAQFTSRLGQT